MIFVKDNFTILYLVSRVVVNTSLQNFSNLIIRKLYLFGAGLRIKGRRSLTHEGYDSFNNAVPFIDFRFHIVYHFDLKFGKSSKLAQPPV